MMEDVAVEGPHGSEQDENYFISMTDMMVGILFVFIILLMVFALNFRTQTDVSDERLKKLEAAAQQAETVGQKLEGLQQQVRTEISNVDASAKVRAQMLEEIRARLAAMGLPVQIDEINGILRLTEAAIRFDVDSADLSPIADANVGKVASVLNEILPLYASGGDAPAHVQTVFIEGHTDITGDDARNWQLSTARAVNTYRRMTAIAGELRRLRNDDGQELLSVSGYSSTRPIPDESIKNYAIQRRIDLRFVMEVDDRERLHTLEDLTDEMQGQLVVLRNAVEAARAN
jgi:outer membrane protein OmpA-like peptidoglycan-associated protein